MSTPKRGTCRICGREFQIKVDGTLFHHRGTRNGLPSYHCDGAGKPPKGVDRDPICTHRTNPAGRVSWPVVAPEAGEAHASTYVCAHPDCIADAKQWVQEITGHRGVFYEFERKATA